MLNRRIYRCAFLSVAETTMHARGNIPEECQRTSSISLRRSDLPGQVFKRGRGARKMTRHQHIPIIVFLDELFHLSPAVVLHDFWNRWHVLNIYESIGDDRELAMAGGQIEMVHQIAVGIGIAKNAGAGIDR